MNLQPIYDDLFKKAEVIAKRGEEHQHLILTFKPQADGYEPHGVIVPRGDKDDIAMVLEKVVQYAPQMYVVVHISECWQRSVPQGEQPDYSRPVAEQPDAKEVVVFTFFVEGKIWIAHCDVDHKKHALKKGTLEEVTGTIEGRFVPQQQRSI